MQTINIFNECHAPLSFQTCPKLRVLLNGMPIATNKADVVSEKISKFHYEGIAVLRIWILYNEIHRFCVNKKCVTSHHEKVS